MRFEQVKGGWAALGEGWAVIAPTQDEAAELFAEAERKHREIDERDSAPNELEVQPA